jgi:phosphoglycolate phosphatase
MKLLLFDIDHTLLQPSKIHGAAFEWSIYEVYGEVASLDSIDCSGKTDRQIILELMRLHKLYERSIQSRLDQCIRVMEKRYAETLKGDELVVMPGAHELLEALSQQPGLFLGLVTGNLEGIAWGKLRKTDLARYFRIGGFGNEDVVRTHLVEHAIQKAVRQQGFVVANNVYVIGDTPRDVVAGHGARAITIGVASGKYSKADLKRAGADWAIESLMEKEKMFDILDLKTE